MVSTLEGLIEARRPDASPSGAGIAPAACRTPARTHDKRRFPDPLVARPSLSPAAPSSHASDPLRPYCRSLTVVVQAFMFPLDKQGDRSVRTGWNGDRSRRVSGEAICTDGRRVQRKTLLARSSGRFIGRERRGASRLRPSSSRRRSPELLPSRGGYSSASTGVTVSSDVRCSTSSRSVSAVWSRAPSTS